MNETEWLNAAQEIGLISDNAVSLDDVADCDVIEAVKVLGKVERWGK